MSAASPIPAPPQVRLRNVTPADFPAMFEMQADPESSRMAMVNPRDRAAFNAHWTKVLLDPAVIAKAILADDLFVGNISCFPRDGESYVGYWIAKSHWSRGIATRALALLLEEVPTRPLHARAASSNTASIRILERNGFKLTAYHHSPATDRYPACEEAIMLLA